MFSSCILFICFGVVYLEDMVVEFLIETAFVRFICNPRKSWAVADFNSTEESRL